MILLGRLKLQVLQLDQGTTGHDSLPNIQQVEGEAHPLVPIGGAIPVGIAVWIRRRATPVLGQAPDKGTGVLGPADRVTVRIL